MHVSFFPLFDQCAATFVCPGRRTAYDAKAIPREFCFQSAKLLVSQDDGPLESFRSSVV